MTSEPDIRRHLAERNADLAAATTLIEALRDERTDLTHEPPTKSGYLLDPVLAHAGSFEAELGMAMREQGAGFPIEQSYGEIIADGQDLGAE